MSDATKSTNASSRFTDAVCQSIIVNGNSLTTLSETSTLWSSTNLAKGDAWLNTTYNPLTAQIDGLNGDNTQAFYGSLANWPITCWSMSGITALQSETTNNWNGDGTSSAENGQASQLGSLVSSTYQLDCSTGDAETKACQAGLQNANTASQPLIDASKQVNGMLDNTANIQLTA